MSPESFAAVVKVLAPVVDEIPDALSRLDSWLDGNGEPPIDVLAALPDVPDLSRGDLELEAMKRRAAKAQG